MQKKTYEFSVRCRPASANAMWSRYAAWRAGPQLIMPLLVADSLLVLTWLHAVINTDIIADPDPRFRSADSDFYEGSRMNIYSPSSDESLFSSPECPSNGCFI